MLDKALSDQARVDSLELFNGRITTIYQWLVDGQIKDLYFIEGYESSEFICDLYLTNFGNPIAWGFSN